MAAAAKLAVAFGGDPGRAIGRPFWPLWCGPNQPSVIRKRQPYGRRAMRNPESPDISAQAYLARLAERGIDYVFANAGTDFAPVIESLAMNANGRRKFPRVITVPH